MQKTRVKKPQTNAVLLIMVGLLGLGLCIALLLQGNDVALFNPKGPIAEAQLRLIMFSAGLLLAVALPTLLTLYFFAWKYRETNTKATYTPGAKHGKMFAFSIWAIPSFFMLILALVMWPATHILEPKKSIHSTEKPITIQVVAMRWKWVFIYPEQDIATVNYVQIPTNTPVKFDITADDAPMSSFWVPHLGGQLYAMTGHVNQLNLMAEEVGDYPGSSAEINGAGFAGMKFIARASSKDDFNLWVKNVKKSSPELGFEQYNKLLEPSENTPVVYFSKAQPDLFNNLLIKYNKSHNMVEH